MTIGRTLMLLLHVGGIGLVVGLSCNWHRIPLGANPPVVEAAWSTGAASPVGILVDPSVSVVDPSAPPPFSDRDWSLGWTNTVAQEVGPGTRLSVHDAIDFDLHRVLVLTAGCRDQLPAATIDSLDAWVHDGGVLIVDLPDTTTAGLAGLEVAANAPRADAHYGFVPDPEFLAPRDGLARLPLYTRFLPDAGVVSETEVLAELGGSPAITSRRHGRGLVVATLFDFAFFVTATQQGRPEEDYRVVSRYPHVLRPRVESNDLMSAVEYHDNPVPIADVIERALFQHVRAFTLVPTLWYWPDGARGVYVMTHDDEEYGAKAEWMPADETTRGVPSTCYYVPTTRLDSESLARVASGGHTLGVHWYRTYRRVAGIRVLGPFMKPVTLADQVDRLNLAIPDSVGPVRHCRLHILEWDDHYTRSFREMAATTIQLDSSYGPDYNCRGYMFGTGYPFRPLDVNGLPFDLHELPYNHSEMESGVDGEYLRGLAERSAAGDHTAIVSLFHPPFWGFVPSVDTYRLWRNAPSMMEAEGLGSVTMETIRAFVRSREETSLTVTPTDEGLRIAYAVPDGVTGHQLALPERVGGQKVRVPAATTTIRSQGGTPLQLLPIEGSGEVMVRLSRR